MPRDILVDDDNDLWVKNGDFVVGESTRQHQAHLLVAQKGEYRQSPASGVGIGDYLSDEDLAELGSEIQKQFESDGMTIRKLSVFEDGTAKIDAGYDE